MKIDKKAEQADTFDLIDSQLRVRQIHNPKQLFELWEKLSYSYLRLELSKYDLDEMKTAVWAQFGRIRVASRQLPKAS